MRFALNWIDATLASARDVTPTIRLFEIEPPAGALPWSPGSHLNISVLTGETTDDRSYSLVGQPDRRVYRIAVKRTPESRGGSRYMWSLQPGARVRISEPHNLFELALDRPDYLLVAGGIGVTPIFGMALALARRGANVRMHYAARSREEFAFAGELRATLGDRLALSCSARGEHLDPAQAIGGLHSEGELYVCGPLGLMEACRAAWQESGRPPSKMRTETFGSSGLYAPQPFRVKVPRLHADILVPANRSMLDALDEAGVEVMADCRRGECGLCVVEILSADTKIDHRDVFFSEEQKKHGSKMCACVSRAVGGEVVIDTAFRGD